MEPFCGGVTVGLTLLHKNLVDHLHMVEMDPKVSVFWKRVLHDPSFIDQVEAFQCTQLRHHDPECSRRRYYTECRLTS